jgi:hypothetical protein
MSDNGAPMTITFKSTLERFEKERSGAKPNTVRVMNAPPYDFIDALNGWLECRIIIKCTDSLAQIERTLTDVSVVGEFCGKCLVVWSWRP